MADDILLETKSGKVARLTMNRPEARNSLSVAMMDRLCEAIKKLGAAKDVHVIVIAANGPGFCAGHDLKEISEARTSPDNGRTFFEAAMAKCSGLMQAIVTCPKPVIAEVHGVATAAGCHDRNTDSLG